MTTGFAQQLNSLTRHPRAGLTAVLLLATGLNLYRLNHEGYSNLYYAAGVRSMTMSWHNAFFVSFDPGGFVAIDKPPVGFWLQALSAVIFGFNGWSILLPQALAAIAAVWLLYRIVAREFGIAAGLISALALAVTPINVVTARDNTIDSLLVPIVLLAAWAAMRAAERGQLRYLLACAALFGIGFNIKSLEALLALPACFALYLAAAPRPLWLRVAQIGAASLVVGVLSLAWVVAVDQVPQDHRPYVGSTTDNSEISLIVGHNGLDRVLPHGTGLVTEGNLGVGASSSAYETGLPSFTRLLNDKLAGQLDWLLPLGVIGMAVAIVEAGRPRRRPSRRQQALLFWTIWFGSETAFFSVANYFHRYYLVVLTPSIAAMVGIGLCALWRLSRQRKRSRALLPIAVLVTAAWQAHMLDRSSHWTDWRVLPFAAAVGAVSILVISLGQRRHLVSAQLIAVGSVALLTIAPIAWAATSIDDGQANPDSPLAGVHRNLRSDPDLTLDQVEPLIHYLAAHRNGARFLIATENAQVAAPIVLTSGQPVMALGGFSGNDPILTADQLAARIDANQVRYFLIPQTQVDGMWRANVHTNPLSIVINRCTPVYNVPLSLSGTDLSVGGKSLIPIGETTYSLYYCSVPMTTSR